MVLLDVQMCGSQIWLQPFSPNRDDFYTYHKHNESQDIEAFSKNTVKGVGEGDIVTDIQHGDNTTRIRLTQVMHVPGTDGKILSLKVLDQKGFKSHIMGGCIRIMKDTEIYTKASLGGKIYEVKMKIVPSQDSVLVAVKRDSSAADLSTWNR